ncbi:MAG TPA: response regulator, partial [Candidatus Eremiobacteraceae bacterium]|nr:response regulator [Candidatus Eremiobacteraceae bacterium]
AIEDALSPLRDCTAKVEREQIDVVLSHLDVISNRLSELAPAVDRAAAAGKAAAEEASRTIRTDLAEADAVLDGVVETHAVMNGLRAVVQSVQQVGQLADLLTLQLTQVSVGEHERGRTNQKMLLAAELRRKVGAAERGLASTVDQMDRELRQLREAAERLRLVSSESLFTTLERMARDTAHAQSKQVTFKSSGRDIRLDAHVLDAIQGALVQIVRNAVAHGIETADERLRAGKPAAGSVSVAIVRRDRRIVFSCSDDGRGVDLEAVRRIAAQRGLVGISSADKAADEVVRVLLRGGISTSKRVTEESGRGIGLDVVREAVERLGGEVICRSEPGAGTTFEIVIPPSLSSMDALIVERQGGNEVVAIPLDAVRATRRVSAREITFAAGGASVLHDDKAIPFLPLASALDGAAWSVERTWAAVIVADGDALAAVGVERLSGTAKIVVRPLPQPMTASPIVIAAALDADGNPQMILDPGALVAAVRRGSPAEPAVASAKRPVLVVDDSLTTRMLEQSILESAGYDVDLAVSAEDALERLRGKRYALILVDVEMPGMDGFAFVERIRSDAKSRDIPAILVTSLAAPEHRRRGREVGAQGYIVKSEFDQAELLSMIQPMMAA